MTDAAGRDLLPAMCILGGLLAVGVAADVPLLRRGKAPVTSALQHVAGRAALTVLMAHRDGLLGRLDPFRAIGMVADR